MLVFASVALLVVMFIALFGGIVYWIIVSQKRNQAEKGELTLELGFRSAGDSEKKIASQILELHRGRPSQRLYVQGLLKREESECDVYLFDLRDSASRSVDPLLENGVAVVSSELDLPRFSVFPKVPGSGKLATVANSLLERFTLGDEGTIALDNNSRFAQEYFLAGDHEGEIRKVMTDDVMDRIAAKLYRQIEAGRNMFTYDRIILDPSAEASTETRVQERVAEALEVFRLLRSRG